MNIPEEFSFTREEVDLRKTLEGKLIILDELFLSIPTVEINNLPEDLEGAHRAYTFSPVSPLEYYGQIFLGRDGKAKIQIGIFDESSADFRKVGEFDFSSSPFGTSFDKYSSTEIIELEYPSYKEAYVVLVEYYKWFYKLIPAIKLEK